MKKIFLLTFLSVFFISCGSSHINSTSEHKKGITKTKTHQRLERNKALLTKKVEPAEILPEELGGPKEIEPTFSMAEEMIQYAKTFQGTRYKFGGTTKAGMDCSGLVCTVFEKENISLPRISRDMATQGVKVSLKNTQKGDLIFFKTSSRNVISHVGLVVEAEDGDVKFIHSTTRAGVIISSLEEDYWKKAFVEVRRVI